MARSKQNSLTKFFSGKFGNEIGLRNYNGMSVLAKLPGPRRYASTNKQTEVMSRFRLAVNYGRMCLADPAANAFYLSKPRKGKSVYRLALKDYLNSPVINKMKTGKYAGNAGDKIVVVATDDFEVEKVDIRITDAAGKLIEQGASRPDATRSVWTYTATAQVTGTAEVKISATAYDHPGNNGENSVTVGIPEKKVSVRKPRL
jgi:hypothetical protein